MTQNPMAEIFDGSSYSPRTLAQLALRGLPIDRTLLAVPEMLGGLL
jgi:hypothetical protein